MKHGWTGEEVSDEEVSLSGFNLLRKDRDRHGGGIAVFISEHLQFTPLNFSTDMQIVQISKLFGLS